MKTVITITKQEITEAIKTYIFERATTGYQYEFGNLLIAFSNNDDNVINLICTVETDILPKEKKEIE